MARNLSYNLKRVVAGVCAVMIVAGAAPLKPLADIVNPAISASAEAPSTGETGVKVNSKVTLTGTGTAEDPYLIGSYEALKAFAGDAATYSGNHIKLTADIVCGESSEETLETVHIYRPITVDLNNYNFTAKEIISSNDVTVRGEGKVTSKITVTSGTFTIEGGEYTESQMPIYLQNSGATLNITGGTFKTSISGTGILNISGGTFCEPIVTGNINISGGTFMYFPEGSTLLDGYGIKEVLVQGETYFKVLPKATISDLAASAETVYTHQPLIAPVTAEGGTDVLYHLGNGEWSYDIPTVDEPGPYTVYAQVIGDDSHADSDVKSIYVQVEKSRAAVTLKLEEGSFAVDTRPEGVTDNGDGTYSVEAGATLDIYSNYYNRNDAVAAFDADGNLVEISYTNSKKFLKDFNEFADTDYKNLFSLEVPEGITNDTPYTIKHIHGFKAPYNKDNGASLYTKCETENGAEEVYIAKLKADGQYYYGDTPSYDTDVELSASSEGLTIQKGTLRFKKVGKDDYLDHFEAPGSYIVEASVIVNGTTYFLTKEVEYSARPVDNESISFYYNNTKLEVVDGKVTVPVTDVYDKTEHAAPVLTLKTEIDDEEQTLYVGRDYTVEGNAAQVNAGVYEYTINGVGNYSGSIPVEWSIDKAEMDVSIAGTNPVYDGEMVNLDFMGSGNTDFTVTDPQDVFGEQGSTVTAKAVNHLNQEFLNQNGGVVTDLSAQNNGIIASPGTYYVPMCTHETSTRKYLTNVYYDGGYNTIHNYNTYTVNADGSLTYKQEDGTTVTRALPEGKLWKWRNHNGWDNNIELVKAVYDNYDLTSAGRQQLEVVITSPNYKDKTIIVDFSIRARKVTITPTADQKTTYGTAAQTPTYTIEQAGSGNTGLLAGDTVAAQGLLTIEGYNTDDINANNAGTYDYNFAGSDIKLEDGLVKKEVGTPSGSHYYTTAMHINYRYGSTVQIYTPEEIGANDQINSIALSLNSKGDKDIKNKFKIYLCDTTATDPANADVRANLKESMTLVYDNTDTEGHQFEKGWNTFVFDTPFVHDTEKNLAVIIVNQTGAYTPSYSFDNSEGPRAYGFYSDRPEHHADDITTTESANVNNSLRPLIQIGVPASKASGNYELVIDNTQKFTVEKKTINPSMLEYKVPSNQGQVAAYYDGQAHAVTIGTAREDEPLNLETDINLIEGAVEVDGATQNSTLAATNAGKYYVYFKLNPDGNYADAEDGQNVYTDSEGNKFYSIPGHWKIGGAKFSKIKLSKDNSPYTGEVIADLHDDFATSAVTVYGIQTAGVDTPENPQDDVFEELNLDEHYTLSIYKTEKTDLAQLTEDERVESIKDVGTYLVVATAKDGTNYSGSIAAVFTVGQGTVSEDSFRFQPENDVYDGKARNVVDFTLEPAKPEPNAVEAEIVEDFDSDPTKFVQGVKFYKIDTDGQLASGDIVAPGTSYTYENGTALTVNYDVEYPPVNNDYSAKTEITVSEDNALTFTLADGHTETFEAPAGYVWKVEDYSVDSEGKTHLEFSLAEISSLEEIDTVKDAGAYIVKYTLGTEKVKSIELYDTFVIKKRDVTLTATTDKENNTKEFLGEPANLKAELSEFDAEDNTGVVSGDKETLPWSDFLVLIDSDGVPGLDEIHRPVGTYEINAYPDWETADEALADQFRNYNITVVPGTYTVTPYDLEAHKGDYTVTLDPSVDEDFDGDNGVPFFTYNGSKHGVKVTKITVPIDENRGFNLLAGRDFSIGGTKVAKNAGDYSVQIVGEGNFTGTYLAEWKIAKAQNTTASVKYGDSEATSDNMTVFSDTYNGKTIADKIKVNVGNGGSDYTVEYFRYDSATDSHIQVTEEDTKNAGSYDVLVTIPETQNYAETNIEFLFDVYRREVEVGSVNLEKTSCAYGEEIPKITGFEFTGEQQPLAEDLEQLTADLISSYKYDEDHKCYSFDSALFEATASYKNYFIADLPDSAEITFESASIENAVVTTAKLALKADGWTNLNSGVVKVEYTMPDGTVKELVEGTDFEFFDDYRTKNVGTYPIILEGKGDFTGEIEVEVEVAENVYNGSRVASYQSYDNNGRIFFTLFFDDIADSDAEFGVLLYRDEAPIGGDGLLTVDNPNVTKVTKNDNLCSVVAKDIGYGVTVRTYRYDNGQIHYGEQITVHYDELIAEEQRVGPQSNVIVCVKADNERRIHYTVNFTNKTNNEKQFGVLLYRESDAKDVVLTVDTEGVVNTSKTDNVASFRAKDIGYGVAVRTYMIVDDNIIYGDQVYTKYDEIESLTVESLF